MGVEKLLLTLRQPGLYPGVETGVEEIGKGFLITPKLNPGSWKHLQIFWMNQGRGLSFSLRKDLLLQTETMGNSLTWTEFCSTFQIYLNLNLRVKLGERKLNCQKNSVDPKGTQIAKHSTALKDTSNALVWALWHAPLHSKMNPRLKLNTMNFVGIRGKCMRVK